MFCGATEPQQKGLHLHFSLNFHLHLGLHVVSFFLVLWSWDCSPWLKQSVYYLPEFFKKTWVTCLYSSFNLNTWRNIKSEPSPCVYNIIWLAVVWQLKFNAFPLPFKNSFEILPRANSEFRFRPCDVVKLPLHNSNSPSHNNLNMITNLVRWSD